MSRAVKHTDFGYRIVNSSSFEFARDVATALMGHRIPFRYLGDAGEDYTIDVHFRDEHIGELITNRCVGVEVDV